MAAPLPPSTMTTPGEPMSPTGSLTIRRPDDWHVHLRDGAVLQAVALATARQYGRAIVMPNLTPPITTVEEARAYRRRILEALPDHVAFTPLMTAYLTDSTDAAELERGHGEGVFTAAKLYPAHATTNSAAGVTDLLALAPVLETMERIGMPLLVHGEVTDRDVDIFDREAVFIERHLEPLLRRHQGLRVVLEHITTSEAVAFVEGAGPQGGGHDHAPSPAHQPQRHVPGGAAGGFLLPAGGQTGASPPGPAAGRHQRASQLLSRHGFRSPSAGGQRIGLRLCRHLQRPLRDRKLCHGV
jgi:hypothetical protein